MYLGNLLAAVAYLNQSVRRDSKLRYLLWSYINNAYFVSLHFFGMGLPQNLSGDREQEYRVRAVGALLFCSEK